MRVTNPPTNPELLDALAQALRRERVRPEGAGPHDLHVARPISSAPMPNEHNADDRQNFSRYYPKRLNAEVLLDAIDQVTGTQTSFDGLPAGTRAVQLPDNSFNDATSSPSSAGPNASSACECERSSDASLAQSLHLLNSKEIQDKLVRRQRPRGEAGGGREAAGRGEDPRAVPPRPSAATPTRRRRRGQAYIEKVAARRTAQGEGGSRRRPAEAGVRGPLWALINTKEFAFNH